MKLKNIYRVRAARNAYTLIELIMVIVILSIIAAVGFIAINSYQTQHLYAAAERIAGDLRYARNLALSSAKWHGASFPANPANTYNLYETDGAADTNIKKPEDLAEDFIVNLSSDYSGVVLSSVDIDGGSKVEFNPFGVPYTDKNASAISATGVITLSSNGSSVTVRIAEETGRIYIE